jgi:hypothetical protein
MAGLDPAITRSKNVLELADPRVKPADDDMG